MNRVPLKLLVIVLAAMGPAGTLLAQGAVGSLTDLANSQGVRIDGTQTNARLGGALAARGDFNGDGVTDMAVGSPSARVNRGGASLPVAGEVFVVFGPIPPGDLDLDSLRSTHGGDGSRGLVIQAEAGGHQLGQALDFIDDLNGDGRDELLIGAPGAFRAIPVSEGSAYLVFGQEPISPELDLRQLRGGPDNTNTGLGVIFLGIQPFGRLGQDVAGIGDINGDGRGDLIIGNELPEPSGGLSVRFPQSFILFGPDPAVGWPALVDLAELQLGLANPGVGVAIVGQESSYLGWSVDALGDFDGDGRNDLVMGASNRGGANQGGAVIVPGGAFGPGSIEASLDLRDAGQRALTLELSSNLAEEYLGNPAAGIGDINGDGRPDLALGAPTSPRFGEEAGAVFVIYGRAASNPLPANFKVDNLLPANGGDGRHGFVVAGRPGDRLGSALDSAGDLNGDGLGDLLAGASALQSGGTDLGGAVVVHGRGTDDPFPGLVSLDDLISGDGSRGFLLTGADSQGRAGLSVAGAGDLNADGSSDYLVGAELEDAAATNSGRAYLAFGAGNDLPGGFSGIHTGAYFEPDAAGQGVMMEIGTLDGSPALFATWYTYLDGDQQWFALGPVPFEPGSDQVTGTLLRTRGTGFGDDFDSAEIINETWGTATLTLVACDQLRWDFQRADGAVSGSLDLRPLLAQTLALPGCRSGGVKVLGFGQGPGQELAGTWWNPARAGEGMVLDIEDRGGQPTAFFSYFTYHQGEQLWLVGNAPVNVSGTAIEDLALIQTSGTGFGGAFDPSEVVSQSWGRASFRFNSCVSATLDYERDGDDPVSGTIDLVRFTEGLLDLDCVDLSAAPAQE